jgi:hypothetical protein
MLKLPDPPPAPKFVLSGVRVNVQPVSCVTVNVCPPAVIVPVLRGPVLAVTVNWTVPLPVPDAPLVIVIHESFAVAVQVQALLEGVTEKLEEAPAAAKIGLPVGDKVNVQPFS